MNLVKNTEIMVNKTFLLHFIRNILRGGGITTEFVLLLLIIEE